MRKRRGLSIRVTWEGLILFMLLAQVFIVQWLALTFYYSLIIDVFFIAYLITHRKNVKELGQSITLVLMLLLYIICQAFRRNAHLDVVFYNAIPVTTSVLIIIIICSLWVSKEVIVKRKMQSIFPYINGYMLLNIPVILLQINDHFELSGKHAEGVQASLKADLISGLFGYFGTPMLATFAAFFFVYDLWYYRNCMKRKHRLVFIIYYSLMFIFYIYISVPSANNGFYLILLLFFVYYFLNINNTYKRVIQKIKSRFILTLSLSIIAVLILLGYRHFDIVTNIIDRYVRTYNYGITSNYYFGGGSYVRFGMIDYFFNSNTDKLFGVGIGANGWKQNYSFGFKNFGQSDLGSILLIGGLFFVFLLITIFAYCISRKNESTFMTILGCLLLLVVQIYTQPFTTTSIMISFMLFILICGLENNCKSS